MNIAQVTNMVMAGQLTPRAQSFVSQVIENSRILGVMNNFSHDPFEAQYRPSAGGQTLAGRAKNANYSSTDLDPAALVAIEQAIVGFILKYDAVHVRDRETGVGIDMDAWYDRELTQRAIDVADELDKQLINGDGSSDTIQGIYDLLDGNNLPGLGESGVIDATTAANVSSVSLDLTDPDQWPVFLEMFDKVKKDVRRAEFVLVNDSLAAKLTTIARHYHKYTQTTDQFGRPVETIDGLPIVSVFDDVIGNAEPDNAGSPAENTTSFLIGMNSEGHWDFMTNSGLALYDVGMLQGEMAEAIKFEVTAKVAVKRKRAIRKVRNIKVTA